MIVGIPKETHPGENRVALTPTAVAALVKAKLEVQVEAGAGQAAGFPDALYEQKGAKIRTDRAELFAAADLLLQVRASSANPEQGGADLEKYRSGQVVIGHADPLTAGEAIRAVAERGATLLAMELIPRITRAQSMDALSSQANLAGYKAVLLGAAQLGKIFPMLMTAAGTIKPARVLVIGAGVAGLQAIATAKRLGAVVYGYDVRPAVKEQVESLGARFVELPLDTSGAEDKGGYAKEQSAEQVRKQQELMAKVVGDSDVVITTALIPGKKAPILVTADMVQRMQPGSVIVDIAAERGGNCELTEPGKIVEKHGVTIIGARNLPATVANHASQMYATNLVKLVELITTADGGLKLDASDEIIAGTLVCRDGQVVHPAVRQALGME